MKPWMWYSLLGVLTVVVCLALVWVGYWVDPDNMTYVNCLTVIGFGISSVGFAVGLIAYVVSLQDIQSKIGEVLNRYSLLDGAKESDTIRRRVRFAVDALSKSDWERLSEELLEVRDLMYELRQTFSSVVSEKEGIDRFNYHLDALVSTRKSIESIRTEGLSSNLAEELDRRSIRTNLDALDVFLTEQLTSLRYASR